MDETTRATFHENVAVIGIYYKLEALTWMLCPAFYVSILQTPSHPSNIMSSSSTSIGSLQTTLQESHYPTPLTCRGAFDVRPES